MNILIPTIGSRGDVQPYIALGLGLQEAGSKVTLATHPVMHALVESYGLRFEPIGPDIDIGQETAAILARSPNWMVGFMRVMRFTFRMLEQAHPDLLRLSRLADLVIVSHSAAGSIEADLLELPTVSATLLPQAIPVEEPSQPLIKRLVGKLAGAGMGFMMTRPINQIRKRVGALPMGPEGITSKKLNLLPISPQVYPPDPRWEERHRMTGYWFADSPEEWSPAGDLIAFLEAGDPPVVISLGAMAIGEEGAQEGARVAIAAVQRTGLRAIVQGWDKPLRGMELPKTIFHGGSLPHSWLLDRAAAIVHHGGFGTTSSGLRAGIPAVVIPHIIDQFIWGQRVYELSAGPKPVPRTKLNAENLAQALDQAVRDENLRRSAASLGEKIRAEDGVGEAVRLILSL
jgi:sterol 3beta-glucosyltransferase